MSATLAFLCCLPVSGQPSSLARIRDSFGIQLCGLEPGELTEESYEVEFQFVEETRSLVATLVPALSITVDPHNLPNLVLRGSPEDVEAGLALLEQLDRPPNEIQYDFRLIALEPAALKELQVSWNPDSKASRQSIAHHRTDHQTRVLARNP